LLPEGKLQAGAPTQLLATQRNNTARAASRARAHFL
jgi:hypothetical protein